jgi:hypothetical protein
MGKTKNWDFAVVRHAALNLVTVYFSYDCDMTVFTLN